MLTCSNAHMIPCCLGPFKFVQAQADSESVLQCCYRKSGNVLVEKKRECSGPGILAKLEKSWNAVGEGERECCVSNLRTPAAERWDSQRNVSGA